MLALGLFAAALAILAILATTWGLDQRRAYRVAEKRRANAFRLANLAGEREQHHRAIRQEAIRQLTEAYARTPRQQGAACSRDLHDNLTV
jgi:hypothetical protein